jgi:hypothetical protein
LQPNVAAVLTAEYVDNQCFTWYLAVKTAATLGVKPVSEIARDLHIG